MPTSAKCWQVYLKAQSARPATPSSLAQWYRPTQLEGSIFASMWFWHILVLIKETKHWLTVH